MDDSRIRHRQGQVRIVGGVPLPDRRTTLSILPNALFGRWLAAQADAVVGRMLDLGAGNQPFRPWYEQLAESVVAVDVAPAPGLDILTSAAPLPFADASFDTILCTSVIEHVEDVESAVAEMFRVLRPGGTLLISAPFLYPTHEAPWDFWRTTHWGLRSLLSRHGFEVVDVAAQGGPIVLLQHYVFGGIGQLIGKAGRMGPLGRLIDNAFLRWFIAAPQSLLCHATTYTLGAASKAASLGYMARAERPAGTLRHPEE